MTLRRHPANPILTRADIPPTLPATRDVSAVFNPGAIRRGEETLLLLRVQTRGRESLLIPARSHDGLRFRVGDEPVVLRGIEDLRGTLHHVYDPRITQIGERFYILVAIDLDDECRLGLVRTDDFERYDFLGLAGNLDARNGVIFPHRVGGRYVRLERPNSPVGPAEAPSGSRIVLSESEDLLDWRVVGPVFDGRPRSWDERIGSGPPPILTDAGWLHLYHGVATHFASVNIYQVGAVLLDAEDPTTVVARTRRNILEPRESYELVGQVPNVVFPGGWVVDRPERETPEEANATERSPAESPGIVSREARIRVYYGAADTCVGLATATVGEIIDACREP